MPPQVFVANPLASAGGRVIASPFQFYVTGEDRLRIISVNSQTSVRVTFRWRFIDTFGKVQSNEEIHTPATNRTTGTNDYELGVGALLNLTAFASSGSPQFGQTFVIVQLIRGIGSAAIVMGTLLAGYVTGTQHLAWPGSPIQSSLDGQGALRTITGTTPGGGTEVSESVPTGARWQLLTFAGTLNESGGVAITPRLLGDDGAGVEHWSVSSEESVATNTFRYMWLTGLGYKVTAGHLPHTAGLSSEIRMLAGQRLRTNHEGVSGSFQWSAITYTVREWLEV
ncbi:MAG: hypothetical protein AUI15_33840 [Actinobacteria bacterium 13_2_20CM_2_66_6]|nr:MAG: hypothetical protein AUI15_33840 [Actinobacteria bacterium 13_2_20CM_2_66_6]